MSEIAKALMFRAIEVAGDSINMSAKDRAAAGRNDLDYGAVLGRQSIVERWGWVPNFSVLYSLRTEHISSKGTVAAPREPDAEKLRFAYDLFQLGGRPCVKLLVQATGQG